MILNTLIKEFFEIGMQIGEVRMDKKGLWSERKEKKRNFECQSNSSLSERKEIFWRRNEIIIN